MDYNSNFYFSYNLAPFYCPVSNFIPISEHKMAIFSQKNKEIFFINFSRDHTRPNVQVRERSDVWYEEKGDNEDGDGDRFMMKIKNCSFPEESIFSE